jgi:hypothetical protein
VQQNHQVLRPLVQNAVAGVGEPDPELAQLAVDLRGDRERRRWCFGRLAAQVLLDKVVDLRDALGQQGLCLQER